ncbi:uncharacterized protein LOC104582961 [Brachypodium distachyon]|uniref:uncharacterized protein LOC104582961 n=1 Tax=Brachypodium distachyon TaxID=15368 RepID=UPI00053007E5|nr:uncharacterized protein LOC104582961 [Brachypodium distachyon]|eukprot:XP_010232834.1 uncharacterized protein LOC104582961 [Brachypodium distachyon]
MWLVTLHPKPRLSFNRTHSCKNCYGATKTKEHMEKKKCMSLIIWIVLDSESLLASLAEAAFFIGLGENREQRDAGGLEIAWSRFFLSPGAEDEEDAGGLSEDDLRLRLASEVLASPGKLMREKTLALALTAAFACSASCRDAGGGCGGAGRRSGRRKSGRQKGSLGLAGRRRWWGGNLWRRSSPGNTIGSRRGWNC